MDLPQQLSHQLKGMEQLVDADSGAILFRHPSLRGISDLVVEGDGYTLEFTPRFHPSLPGHPRSSWHGAAAC